MNIVSKTERPIEDNEKRLITSCIKHWGLGGYIMYSAPHQLSQRQTGTKPAIPNVSYM